jgi:signal transduction histidine kinase
LQILAGILVLAVSTIYTSYLTKQLKQGEYNKVETLKLAFESLSSEFASGTDLQEDSDDITFESYILENNKTIPLIVTDEQNNISDAYNFGPTRDTNYVYLKRQLIKIIDSGQEPFEVTTEISYPNQPTQTLTQYIYYKHSATLRLLSLFPIFQLLLIMAFVGLGYYSLRASNRSEKNRIWAGLAKETAHQLGTPISAILAWLELLESANADEESNKEIYREMKKDVDRLNLIADRFGKIGSRPVLKRRDLGEMVEHAVAYMKRRASRNVKFVYHSEEGRNKWVNVNPPLFEWVVENLLRNALDAMEGKGNVVLDIYNNGRFTCLDISDTGKGIPASKFHQVFEPGFSTKKRGWGLGLSLAKRIIENYHHGKIFVKESKLNVGTTFTIQLPKAEQGI